MNANFREQTVDGFGDRPDIALERDKAEGQIRENAAIHDAEKFEAILKASMYGTSGNAQNISEIISEMIEAEGYGKSILKSQIIWDVENLAEAVNLACINLGLSDEDFAPSSHDDGFSVDIRLV